ncbi:MAG: LysM domain-containing protein, partial [Oscillospiraceae bacterium]
MPKTSKKAEFTENADRSIVAVTFKEMKHNFSKYMTKFGAHIVHLFSFAGSNVYKILKNAMVFIGNKIAPNFKRISKEFKYIGKEIQSRCYLTKDYFAEMLADAKEIKAEDGVFSSVKYCLRGIGQKIWSKRGFAVTAFNWAAPVVSIAFLVGVVSYAADVQYGVSVECNGQKLGVVAEESIYDEAEKEMQQRITYVDDNKTISISPKLSVQAVKTTTKIVNSNQLADQMIVNSDAELLNAYGVYVDGQFVGAVADKKPIENALASVLAKYDTTGAKEVSLSKDVDYRQGFYLKSSLVPAAKINQTLTSNKQVEVKYTIQKDDTPIIIADKNNISLAQLMSLNPNIVSDCTVGDQVLLTQAEPFIA